MKAFIVNKDIVGDCNSNSEIWENIFSKKEWGKYPSEAIIRFIARNFYNTPNRNEVKILELGLGTGANLWFCAREGFRVSGIEYSQSGIERFYKRMGAENLSNQIDIILQGDYFDKLDDIENESFDAVIDVGSLVCNDTQKTKTIFLKAMDKLKNGGKFFSSTLATGIFGYDESKGKFQEPQVGIYTNVGTLRFETKESVKELYKSKDFNIESIATSSLEKDDKILDKLYIIEGIKIGGGNRFLIIYTYSKRIFTNQAKLTHQNRKCG